MEFKMNEQGFTTDLDYGELHISSDETQGFRPFQLMVASVVGCSGITIKKVLGKMRIPYEDVDIRASVERNEDEANRIEHISLHFVIKGTDLKEAKIQKALDVTQKNCSMVQSIKGSVRVTESFELVNSN